MHKDHIDAIASISEEQKTRKVQVAYTPNLQPNLPDYSTSFTLGKTFETTLQSAQKKDDFFQIETNNPELKKPQNKKALGTEIALAIQRNEENLKEITKIILNNITTQNKKISQLSQEDQKSIQEILTKMQKQEDINTIRKMLNIVSSSSSIFIGSCLLSAETLATIISSAAGAALYASAPPLLPYLLIGSGLSKILIDEFLPKTSFFENIASFFTSDKKLQNDLADKIQFISSLATSAISIASSISAFPLVEQFANWGDVAKLFSTTFHLSQTSTNVISEFNESTIKDLQSTQTVIEGKLQISQFELDKSYSQLESVVEIEKNIRDISYNIFQILQQIAENNLK